MQTVWKYELGPVTVLDMPIGAEILCVASQSQWSNVCLWARVDVLPDRNPRTEKRRFVICGTGKPDAAGRYVGTAFVGDFVWHVFETGAR